MDKIYIAINFIIVFYFLIAMLKAYKKGFVYELLRLIFAFFSFFLAWLIAPVLASFWPLVKESDFADILLKLATPYINIGIWFVIILVILFGVSLFILPFFKSISRLPFLGPINRLLGLFIGLINAGITLFVISMLLTLPLIPNGKNIRSYTLFKPINTIGNKIVLVIGKSISLQKIDSQSAKARKAFLEILEKYGKYE